MKFNIQSPFKAIFVVLLLSSFTVATAHAQDDQELPKKTVVKTKTSKKTTSKTTATDTAAKSSDSTVSASGGMGDAQAGSSGEQLKFSTDATPASTDSRPTMQFVDPGATPLGDNKPSFAETIPDADPYKSYIGYPKQRFGITTELMNLSSSFDYNGRQYNFPQTSVALGLNYTFLITPMWNIGIDYQHYSAKMNEATSIPFNFHASTETYDDYVFKFRYCQVSRATFYRQFCPGIDVGNESYPILKFAGAGSNDLYLGKVQDVVIGVNINYQEPFSDRFMFRAGAGYNMGTGLGNSGSLTSVNNSMVNANAGLEYFFASLHSIQAGLDYQLRNAKLKGATGNFNDTWTTKSSLLGFKAGYALTFP